MGYMSLKSENRINRTTEVLFLQRFPGLNTVENWQKRVFNLD